MAFAQTGTLQRADVEHPEQLRDPGQQVRSFSSFRLYRDEASAETVRVSEAETDHPQGHVECEGLTLYGSFNTSLWKLDEYLLDDVVDESLREQLSALDDCVIQNGESQWVVRGADEPRLWLVTGLLNRDFTGASDRFELEPIEGVEVGDIFLRLLFARLTGRSSKTALRPHVEADGDLPPTLPVDLASIELETLSAGWEHAISPDTRVLRLQQNALTELPEGLRRLTRLEELDLSYTQLTTLPDWISELSALKRLKASVVPLTRLPDSLCQLRHLERLECALTQLTQLPNELGTLTALRTLDLRCGKLTALPDSLGQLTALRTLDASENQLSALPSSLAALEHLESLVLNGNPLEFSAVICELTALKNLNLSKAKVSSVPEGVGRLAALERLQLNGNRLSVLPRSVMQLPLLAFVDVSSNELTTLPDFSGAARLRALYATSNQIEQLPITLKLPEAMVELWLQRNPLTTESKQALGVWGKRVTL